MWDEPLLLINLKYYAEYGQEEHSDGHKLSKERNIKIFNFFSLILLLLSL